MEISEIKIPSGMCFSIISRFFRRQMDELLSEHGLTGPQLGVLGQLHRLEKQGRTEINQRDVETASHLSHTTVTEILRKLESKGFVASNPSEKDKRSKCLKTTAKAAVFGEEIGNLDRQIYDTLCRGLSDTERSVLSSAANVMVKNAIETYRKKGTETQC